MAEFVHAPTLEGINADPFQLEFAIVAQHGLDARDDVLRLLFLFRIGLPAELEVDAVNVVGFAVQQHRLPGMERRIEPEPALGREISLHHDVSDEETVHENLAVNFQVRACGGWRCARHRPPPASRSSSV
jgi:hypothetical protein